MTTPTLLCTLGNSWAVVPEAYLMGNGTGRYAEVSVLATSGIDPSVEACREWFAAHAPDVSLRVFVIADLPDIRDAHDHARYEEALFRVFACLWLERTHEGIHLCLAGGFKTISSAAHQTADLFGCAKLFHITTPSKHPDFANPRDLLAAIEDELRNGLIHSALHLIDLGDRPGWPTLQQLLGEAPALPGTGDPFHITDTRFRERILNRLREANRLAQSEHELASLPFPQIARWSPAPRDWLRELLDPIADAAWVLSLPKVDLHCHLGGFATEGSLLHEVRQAASDPGKLENRPEPEPLDGWPLRAAPIGLEAYRRRGDANGSALLKDPGCLKRHIELLYAHFQEQNLIYAEVRCSPANYSGHGRSSWDILAEIRGHLERCRSEADAAGRPAPLVNLIVIATRQSGGDFRTGISRHLALAATAFEHWTDDSQTRVVGVDLAGFEDRATRAHYFRDDFMAALRLGMGITVHAGENDDAEGIWSAILDLNARRLGHALHLAPSPSLLRTVADRRIGVEMCPYANLQIVGYPLDADAEVARALSQPTDYPLQRYLRAGVPVTVNTDNIGISAASLTENFLLLPRLCPGITRLEVLQLVRNAIDQAFLPAASKSALLVHPIPRPA